MENNDKNINGQIPVQRQSKPISLSAFNNRASQGNGAPLKINAQEPTDTGSVNAGRTTVSISSNFRKGPVRRSINSINDINSLRVNPNDVIPMQEKEVKPSMQQQAFSALDRVVKERKEEFRNFIASAEESDKHNRELIEAGIEDAPEEMNYLPDQVDAQVEDEIKKKEEEREEKKKAFIKQASQDSDESVDEDLYDIESDLEEELGEDLDHEDTDYSSYFNNIRSFDEDEEVPSDEVVDEEEEIYKDEDNGPDESMSYIFGDEDSEGQLYTYEDEDSGESYTMDENEETPYDESDNQEPVNYDDPTEPPFYISDSDIEADEDEEVVDVEEEQIEEEEPVKEEENSTDIQQEIEQVQKSKSDIMAESLEKMRNADKTIKDAIDSRIVKTSTQNIDNNTENSSNFEIDESDIDDEQTTRIEESDELTQDELDALVTAANANLKTEILAKVLQTSKKLDISSFSVSKSVIPLNEAIRKAKKADNNPDTNGKRISSWPMIAANRPFFATPLQGSDMALMYSEENRRAGDSVITQDQAKIIYEHDANPYKPNTLKAWSKTIPFYDIDSLFAAIYCSTMTGANYIPRYCSNQKCQYAFLTENIPITDMVNLDDENTKKKFEKIRAMKPTPENSAAYESVISIINDKYAVGIKAPSLYTILYELNSISDAFREKYKAVINLIQFIDYIYVINQETNTLEPIGWKSYVGDDSKTYKSKIATYSKILRDLSATEFGVLMSLITSMQNEVINSAILSYRIPETKCPKCGSKIEQTETLARDLVFTRQRLVDIATTPSER